jgi:hypothetical protein
VFSYEITKLSFSRSCFTLQRIVWHYLCKYQKAWEAEFSWVSHSDRSVNDAYCILCKSQLSIGSSAKNDLTRHAKSQNHMQLEAGPDKDLFLPVDILQK